MPGHAGTPTVAPQAGAPTKRDGMQTSSSTTCSEFKNTSFSPTMGTTLAKPAASVYSETQLGHISQAHIPPDPSFTSETQYQPSSQTQIPAESSLGSKNQHQPSFSAPLSTDSSFNLETKLQPSSYAPFSTDTSFSSKTQLQPSSRAPLSSEETSINSEAQLQSSSPVPLSINASFNSEMSNQILSGKTEAPSTGQGNLTQPEHEQSNHQPSQMPPLNLGTATETSANPPSNSEDTLVKYDPERNVKKILDQFSCKTNEEKVNLPATDSDKKEPVSTAEPTPDSDMCTTEHSPLKKESKENSSLPALPKSDVVKAAQEPSSSLSILSRAELGNMSDEELERELAAFEDEGNASFDEDDAAVYLQELGINYGMSARSSKSTRTRLNSRSRLGASVQRVLRSPRCGSSGGWSAASATARRQSTKALVESSLELSRRDNGAHMYRLLSAKRNHIQELSNDAVLLQKKIKELEEKNRLLVRLCKRQEAELRKFHEAKSELPHLLEAHKMEILVLQDRLRKLTEAHRRDTSKLRQQEERIFKSTEEATRLKELTKKRNLPEREELNRKLCATQGSLAEKQLEVDELQRRLALVEKSGRQQLAAEEGRHRATNRRLQALRRDHRALQKTLQERDKELAAVQHYRSRAISALTSKGARGSTSNLSTSSTTGFSSMHMSSASSRSTSVSAHPGGRTQRLSQHDTSDVDQDGVEPLVVQSDVEGQRITTRRTKSGRMLPPISAQQRSDSSVGPRSDAQARRQGLRSEPATCQVSQGWRSHWWSQSQEEDSQTYNILSSPEPLSSTSPLSATEHQSPSCMTKSAAETGVIQLPLDHAVSSMFGDGSQVMYGHLSRSSMPRNTFEHEQMRVQKVSRKNTYSRSTSDCPCSAESNQYIESNQIELDCNCPKLSNNFYHAKHSCSREILHQEGLDGICPAELVSFQAEKLKISSHPTQPTMVTTQCSTLSSTSKEDLPKPDIDSLNEHKCTCALVTDDSSVNPSPDLRGSTTTDCEADLSTEAGKCPLEDVDSTEADRKDSNTSNVTDVSYVTSTSNVSKISNASENSVPSTDDPPAAYVRRRSCADQFSLIENYPPKERRKLQKEVGSVSAGSDTSGSGPSPPPVRGVPSSAARYRPPPSAKLSRQNSVGIGEVLRHKHTVSLTHLDARKQSGTKDARAAITP